MGVVAAVMGVEGGTGYRVVEVLGDGRVGAGGGEAGRLDERLLSMS